MTSLNRHRTNQRGNTLLSVVVAGAIGATILMASLRGIQSNMKSQKLVDGMGDYSVLQAKIVGMLGSDQICAELFRDKDGERAKFDPDVVLPPKPTTEQLNDYKEANTLYQLGLDSLLLATTDTFVGGLFIKGIALAELDKKYRTTNTVGDVATKRIYSKLIVLTLKGSTNGSQGLPKAMEFPLVLDVGGSGDSKGTILHCSNSMRLPASIASCPSGEAVSAVNFENKTVTCSPVTSKSVVAKTGECGLPTVAEECKYDPQIVKNSDGTCWAVCVWKDNYVWYESKDTTSAGAVWSKGLRVSESHTDQDVSFYLNADDTMCIEGQAYGTSQQYRQCYSKSGTALSGWTKI